MSCCVERLLEVRDGRFRDVEVLAFSFNSVLILIAACCNYKDKSRHSTQRSDKLVEAVQIIVSLSDSHDNNHADFSLVISSLEATLQVLEARHLDEEDIDGALSDSSVDGFGVLVRFTNG